MVIFKLAVPFNRSAKVAYNEQVLQKVGYSLNVLPGTTAE